MSNSTAEVWSIDGTSLNTFAFNISTVGGDRLAPPPLRGTDIVIPGVAGRRWMPKVVDSRTITLGMWVIGADENGNVSDPQQAQFDTNFRKIRNLLWQPNRQFDLTKNFYVDGVLKTATAKGQFAGGLIPTMTGRTRAVFTVDIFLADPYFYGPDVITTLTTGTKVVAVEGDDVTKNIKFTFNGSRTNPKVRNSTQNVDVEYRASLSSGDKVDINVQQYTSTTTPNGASAFSTAGSIRHTGSPSWMELAPGNNSVVLSSDSGIGVVTMTHKAAWL